MKSEILKLVFDYSKNGRLADVNFIEKIIEFTVEEENLQQYVNKLKFVKLKVDGLGFCLAAYDIMNYNLEVDPETIARVHQSYTKYDGIFSGIEPLFYRNFTISRIIQHELEHAKQLRQANSLKTDWETRLLNICFEDSIILHDAKILELVVNGKINYIDLLNYSRAKRLRQNQFYWQDPCERLAQINSYEMVVECLEQIKNYCPNLLEVEKNSLLVEMISGYFHQGKQLVAPTSTFLTGMHKEDFWKNLDFYDDNSKVLQRNVEKQYDLQKRLKLGLPIRNREYQKVKRSITIL